MAPPAAHTQWYLARDGQQFGPLSDTELGKFVELGHLQPTDLLWREGFPDWRPAMVVFPPRKAAMPRPVAPARPVGPLGQPTGPQRGAREQAMARQAPAPRTGTTRPAAEPSSPGRATPSRRRPPLAAGGSGAPC